MKSKYNVNEIRAKVTECLGDNWQVCVDFFGAELTAYGEPYVAKQVMETFSSKQKALEFVKGFNYQHLTITEGGEPWYKEEGKWQFAHD